MNPLLSDLTAILSQELQLHEQLLASASDMNAALRARKTLDVARCNSRSDVLFCQIEELEEKRLTASDRLAESIGCKQRHATIRQVIALLPPDDGAQLSELRLKLRSILGELNRVNCSNKMFLENGLRWIGKTFEIIANNSRKITGYQAQGGEARMALNTAVINRVA